MVRVLGLGGPRDLRGLCADAVTVTLSDWMARLQKRMEMLDFKHPNQRTLSQPASLSRGASLRR